MKRLFNALNVVWKKFVVKYESNTVDWFQCTSVIFTFVSYLKIYTWLQLPYRTFDLNRFVGFQFHLSAFDSELLPDDSVAVLGVANDGLAGFELPLRILVALVVPILRRRMKNIYTTETNACQSKSIDDKLKEFRQTFFVFFIFVKKHVFRYLKSSWNFKWQSCKSKVTK